MTRVHPQERIAYRTGALQEAGLWREPADGRGSAEEGSIDTRSNDYLGLAAAGAVSRETGCGDFQALGAGASRLVSGTWRAHEALEAALAAWLRTEASLLFSSGYAANLGALSALVGPGEVVISDALNHASIIDGCRLSRARTVIIPHCSLHALERALADSEGGVRWVVTESYYGMDADSPDLCAIRRLCDQFGAALVVDEAHALGVFGPEGRGVCAELGVEADVLIGGLGKAFGASGGFVATSRLYRDWLWNRARSFVFSTGVSPHLCALIQRRLDDVRSAHDARSRLAALEARMEGRLIAAGVQLPPNRRGPIFPIVIGGEADVLHAARVAGSAGVRCQPIRPPTVPAGASRLRVSLRATMTDEDVDRIVAAVVRAWESRTRSEAGSSPDDVASTALEHAPRVGDGRPSSAAGAARSLPAGAPGHADVEQLPGLSSMPFAESALPAEPALATGAPISSGIARGDTAGSGPRWVVLGVGTGVGKTYVSRTLVSLLAERGHAAAGLKPIETGITSEAAAESDAATLERVSFHVKHPSPHPLYAFRDPITPSLAARREQRSIDLASIRPWLETLSPRSPELTLHAIIETAGGVFSPLSDGQTNLELAGTLGDATWVLVASDRLGVLHDVSSTLVAMQSRARLPNWIVLSAPAAPDASTGTNAAELRRLPGMPPIIELPRDDAASLLPLLEPTS